MNNEVHVLFEGYCRVSPSSRVLGSRRQDEGREVMEANCTCVLLKGPKNVLVDTMTPWDGHRILEKLRNEHGLKPNDIDYVVCTHGHCDHVGNNNLFLDSTQIVGHHIFHRDQFYPHDFAAGHPYIIGEGGPHEIRVVPTRGHTLDSVSVTVSNTRDGVVSIVGDLFERLEDIRDGSIWREAGSEDPDAQIKNRLEMAMVSSHIVPGHGPMFRVTEEHRSLLRAELEEMMMSSGKNNCPS